jgi:GTPase SAR1 family protein
LGRLLGQNSNLSLMTTASSPILKPGIQSLQQGVISLLKNIEELMGRASRSLSGDESGAKYLRFQEEVGSARFNVTELELVLAIVAPMKAGKSTIINAIVGQYLLPSRASAMTTLPTRIVLCADKTEPILEIEIDILQKTLSGLRQRIQEIGIDEAKARMAKRPHLHELLEKIEIDCSISSKTTGLEAIKQSLTDLNDIVRICSVLEPSIDPLRQSGFTMPQIQTPFWQATDNNQSKFLGNLVIVDTPGPNEAGQNLRLSAVVDEQLRISSMILIVLDFTQLNNQAAAEIKRQIAPMIQSLGKKKLYVLVNKVDQRTAKDPMTSEMVQQFILADLGLGEPRDAERVFEVSARQAFCAARFLSELRHFPDIKKEDMKTAKDLGEQAFGLDWEEEFEEASLEDLQSKAQRLWKKSGFEPFLTKAINVLMESAAPLCIGSALDLSRSRLEELRNCTQLRGSAIDQDAKKLSAEIVALQEDLNCLEACRQTIQDVDDIKKKLKDVLDNLLRKLKIEAEVTLGDYFDKEKYDRSDLAQKLVLDIRLNRK